MSPQLILASSSRYRRELLSRLRLPFQVHSPSVDETRHPDEPPLALAQRLAQSKAEAVATQFPGAWVIGSDQVAVARGQVLGKPGNAKRCAEQLELASGNAVSFYTAVSLLRCEASGAYSSESHVDTTVVLFRAPSGDEIGAYIDVEQPFDCAGGFKVEGLGISLFERIDNQDPTALVGLPLIWLAGALRRAALL
jgi:septum formation protein